MAQVLSSDYIRVTIRQVYTVLGTRPDNHISSFILSTCILPLQLAEVELLCDILVAVENKVKGIPHSLITLVDTQ